MFILSGYLSPSWSYATTFAFRENGRIEWLLTLVANSFARLSDMLTVS